MKKVYLGLVGTTLLLVGGIASAAPLGYNISWHGSNSYSLTGMFSYMDTGQTHVRGHDLTSFMIQGWHGDRAIGSFSGMPEFFRYRAGADYISTGLQLWNFMGDSMGYACILTGCGMTKDERILFKSIAIGEPIKVTPKMAEVELPEPATLGIVLAGLAAFGLRRRARN